MATKLVKVVYYVLDKVYQCDINFNKIDVIEINTLKSCIVDSILNHSLGIYLHKENATFFTLLQKLLYMNIHILKIEGL